MSPQPPRLALRTVQRLFGRSKGLRWGLSVDQFRAALEHSVSHAFAERRATVEEVERYADALHLEDLALACACAAGAESAWDHFIREHRPVLYRAADAIDPSGGARDLADALYADLFGLKERDGQRASLFRYFHGRSSLATWLRSVLSQRLVDRVREHRRLDSLPDDDSGVTTDAVAPRDDGAFDSDRPRHQALMRSALTAAIDTLAPRDRLRLSLYYAQDLSLAAIGRALHEHEATVSRHLTRARAEVRRKVEDVLRAEHGLDDRTIAECVQAILGDVGSLDIAELMRPRKNSAPDRSL